MADEHRRAACCTAVICFQQSLPATWRGPGPGIRTSSGSPLARKRLRRCSTVAARDRLFLLFSSPGAGTAQHQLAAWVVEDLQAEVAELRARGVEFEEYDQPGLRTVDGIAITPVGKAAWFKDSEGNVLTITQLGYGTTGIEGSGPGI